MKQAKSLSHAHRIEELLSNKHLLVSNLLKGEHPNGDTPSTPMTGS
jgi:hypothetical protein